MPIFDYRCECGKTYECIEFGDELNEVHWCKKCGKTLNRLFPANSFSFRLKYDPKKDKCSWGAEGYARTQYYDEINKRNAK
jgi:putative FmdB family regulatory protein